jgi:hypothetical protein
LLADALKLVRASMFSGQGRLSVQADEPVGAQGGEPCAGGRKASTVTALTYNQARPPLGL